MHRSTVYFEVVFASHQRRPYACFSRLSAPFRSFAVRTDGRQFRRRSSRPSSAVDARRCCCARADRLRVMTSSRIPREFLRPKRAQLEYNFRDSSPRSSVRIGARRSHFNRRFAHLTRARCAYAARSSAMRCCCSYDFRFGQRAVDPLLQISSARPSSSTCPTISDHGEPFNHRVRQRCGRDLTRAVKRSIARIRSAAECCLDASSEISRPAWGTEIEHSHPALQDLRVRVRVLPNARSPAGIIACVPRRRRRTMAASLHLFDFSGRLWSTGHRRVCPKLRREKRTILTTLCRRSATRARARFI